MIPIARPESSNNGTGGSSLASERGGDVDIGQDSSPIVRAITRFVAQRPGFCLGAALSLGIAFGWWVKRT